MAHTIRNLGYLQNVRSVNTNRGATGMKQHARFTHRGKYASAWGERGTGEGHEGVKGGCERRSSITTKAQCDRCAGVKCILALAMEHGVKPASGSDYERATTSRERGIEKTAKHRAWAYRERCTTRALITGPHGDE